MQCREDMTRIYHLIQAEGTVYMTEKKETKWTKQTDTGRREIDVLKINEFNEKETFQSPYNEVNKQMKRNRNQPKKHIYV